MKINTKLLEQQIELCDEFANFYEKINIGNIGKQFECIANLLSEIRFVAEMGKPVSFEVCNED